MMRRIDLRGAEGSLDYRAALPRAELDVEAALQVVRPICEAVRTRGVEAILELSERFDGVVADDIVVPAEALARALAELDPDVRAALEESIRRLRASCEAERETDTVTTYDGGATVTHRMVPVDRVGLYVPGGVAPLVSSVVMNVVPAQVAGVRSIALTSSPQRDHGGLPHPTILAACALLGVDEVYAVGGAQAIAMFAYGAGPCRARRPGHRTGLDPHGRGQAAAQGRGRDRLRGRAHRDRGARRRHRRRGVRRRRPDQPGRARRARGRGAGHAQRAARRRRRGRAGEAGARDPPRRADPHRPRAARQSAIVLVDDLEQGLAVVDAYAAEHLEIQTEDAATGAARVRNAGAIFVGSFAPVSLGDYCAGSNHVLPTGGCACHSSGLSVRSFLRSVHVVDYGRDALAEVADHVVALAEAEDLPAHGAAVRVRLER